MSEPRPEITRYMSQRDEPTSASEKEGREMWLRACDWLAKSIARGQVILDNDDHDDDFDLHRDDDAAPRR